MLRLTKSLLPILAALLYTATASAYKITVEHTSGGYKASDTLVVDVRVNTEGMEAYGWGFYVLQDLNFLSPNESASHLNPIPNQDAGSLYLYPSGEAWYVANIAFAGNPSINQSVATLVFHVVADVPTSGPMINLNFDYGPYGDFAGEGGKRVTGLVILGSIHLPVPEPTTITLLGLGLVGISYAGRRRRRAP